MFPEQAEGATIPESSSWGAFSPGRTVGTPARSTSIQQVFLEHFAEHPTDLVLGLEGPGRLTGPTLYFRAEETDGQRGEVTFPRSLSLPR